MNDILDVEEERGGMAAAGERKESVADFGQLKRQFSEFTLEAESGKTV